jgi:hypothetical protein
MLRDFVSVAAIFARIEGRRLSRPTVTRPERIANGKAHPLQYPASKRKQIPVAKFRLFSPI